MRVLVLALVAFGLVFPRSLESAGCDDDLLACYSSTILFNSPEDYDLITCQADYIYCLARALRFA